MLSKRVTVDGVPLAYDVWGAGDETLICLHGGMGIDSSYLRTKGILDLARGGRRVVLYDQRGHGASGRSGIESYTHAKWTADLHALAGSLQVGRFALLGHSYGGFLALEYAVRYAPTLTHLILVGTSSGPVRGRWPHPRRDGDVEAFFRARWPRFFARENLHEDVLDRIAFSWEPFVAAFHGELPMYDLREKIGSLDLPVLLVVGSGDAYRPNMEWLAKRLPNARLEVIPRAGHFPFLEDPDCLRAVVDGFLGAPSS